MAELRQESLQGYLKLSCILVTELLTLSSAKTHQTHVVCGTSYLCSAIHAKRREPDEQITAE